MPNLFLSGLHFSSTMNFFNWSMLDDEIYQAAKMVASVDCSAIYYDLY